jgi:hypothetical protein
MLLLVVLQPMVHILITTEMKIADVTVANRITITNMLMGRFNV